MSASMTDHDLLALAAEALALDEKATPGPWIDGESGHGKWLIVVTLAPGAPGEHPVITRIRNDVSGRPIDDDDRANARFIARARELLPLLARALLERGGSVGDAVVMKEVD